MTSGGVCGGVGGASSTEAWNERANLTDSLETLRWCSAGTDNLVRSFEVLRSCLGFKESFDSTSSSESEGAMGPLPVTVRRLAEGFICGTAKIVSWFRSVTPPTRWSASKGRTYLCVEILPVLLVSSIFLATRTALEAIAGLWLLAGSYGMLIMISPRPHFSAIGAEVLKVFGAQLRAHPLAAALPATACRCLGAWLDRVVHVISLRTSLAALDAEVLGFDQVVVVRLGAINLVAGSHKGCLIRCRLYS